MFLPVLHKIILYVYRCVCYNVCGKIVHLMLNEIIIKNHYSINTLFFIKMLSLPPIFSSQSVITTLPLEFLEKAT